MVPNEGPLILQIFYHTGTIGEGAGSGEGRGKREVRKGEGEKGEGQGVPHYPPKL